MTTNDRLGPLGYVGVVALPAPSSTNLIALARLMEPSLPPNVNTGILEALAAGWTPDKSASEKILPVPLVLHDVADQRFMEEARERWRRRHPDRAFPGVTATALLLAGWSRALRDRMTLLPQDIQDQAATYTKARHGGRTSGFGHAFAGWMERLVQMAFPARLAQTALYQAGEALLGTEWDSDNLPGTAERLIAKFGEDPHQKEHAEKEARIAAEADTRPADAEGAYFTSAIRTADRNWVALRGPYETHEAALRAVPDDWREAEKKFEHDKDVMLGGTAFGTVRAPRGTKVVLGPAAAVAAPGVAPTVEQAGAIAAFLAWFDKNVAERGAWTTWGAIDTGQIDVSFNQMLRVNDYLYKLRGYGLVRRGGGPKDSIDPLRAALTAAPVPGPSPASAVSTMAPPQPKTKSNTPAGYFVSSLLMFNPAYFDFKVPESVKGKALPPPRTLAKLDKAHLLSSILSVQGDTPGILFMPIDQAPLIEEGFARGYKLRPDMGAITLYATGSFSDSELPLAVVMPVKNAGRETNAWVDFREGNRVHYPKGYTRHDDYQRSC